MKCKYLKIRSKKYKKYFFCSVLKKEIMLESCLSCSDKTFVPRTPLKKASRRHLKAERERYSIIYPDLSKCAVCRSKNGPIDLNEVFMGRNRPNSIKYGLIMPLCRTCHMKYHSDRSMQLYYMKLAEKKFIEYYNKSVYEFIDIFKRNYL